MKEEKSSFHTTNNFSLFFWCCSLFSFTGKWKHKIKIFMNIFWLLLLLIPHTPQSIGFNLKQKLSWLHSAVDVVFFHSFFPLHDERKIIENREKNAKSLIFTEHYLRIEFNAYELKYWVNCWLEKKYFRIKNGWLHCAWKCMFIFLFLLLCVGRDILWSKLNWEWTTYREHCMKSTVWRNRKKELLRTNAHNIVS